MAKLLQGIKVLDLTRVLSGPYASMILADLGAEILKIELPEKGDEARAFGPFQNGESAYFAGINRGKKSITIDLRKPKGQELIFSLAGKCDILMENFRPGSMEEFNLGFERLHKAYPKLVYASISGFGQTGPYSRKPAYDVIIQAMSGLVSITGTAQGEVVRVGSSIADLNSSLFSIIGILAASYNANQKGIGQHVDISMLDCQIALLENAMSRYHTSNKVPGPIGSRHPSITPFQFFKAADGQIVIAAANDNLWKKLCGVIGLEEDGKFKTNDLRTQNHLELESLLNDIFKNKTVKEWCGLLESAGVPCSSINNIEQVINDPHVNFREMVIKMNHPKAGILTLPNSPLKFSDSKNKLNVPSPLLGEHTEEILSGFLGLTIDEINELKEDRVI